MTKDWVKLYGNKAEPLKKPKKDWIALYGDKKERQTDIEQSFLNKLPRNIGAGLSEAVRGFANIGHGLHIPGAPYFPEEDYGKQYGLTGEPTLSDKIIQGLTQFVPSFALPAAKLGRVGELIGNAPKAGKFLQRLVSEALPQAAYGATQNENPLEGAAEGAIGAGIGTGIGSGIERLINKARPSNFYSTPLSKKELVKAYQGAKGTPMDLGSVIENPKLKKRFENKLATRTEVVPEKQKETANEIVSRGEQVLDKLLGNKSPENVPEQLHGILTNEYEKHHQFKNALYKHTNELADKEGLKLELPKFSKKAQKYEEAIKQTNILQHEPDAKAILGKLINYKEPVKETTTKGMLVDKFGKPLIEETKKEFPTLAEANILKGKLNQYAQAYGKSPDADKRNMARIFGDLAKSLRGDIRKTIATEGSEDLQKAYHVAEENYKKNFSPFLDKDIYKFVSGQADPQTIVSKFITTSNVNDLSGKLSKLAEKLKTPADRNLLGYAYLSRALDKEGNLNPSKLATLTNKLGSNQFKALFPEKSIRKSLQELQNLTKKNPEALHLMFNPKTGARALDYSSGTVSKIAGGLMGLAAGGTPWGLIGALAAPSTVKQLAKKEAQMLTSEKLRRAFVKGKVTGKDIKIPEKIKSGLAKTGSVAAQAMDKKYQPMELELTGGHR